MNPLVHIVTLNWNNPSDTRRCLDSIDRLDYDNLRVIVVDNGSGDDSLAALRADPRDFELIANPSNLGYAGGNNVAIRRALEQGADYVWLLNNDAVTEPDTLSRLVAAMQTRPDAGMASPVIRYSGAGTIEYAAGWFDPDRAAHAVTSDLGEARDWLTRYPDRISLFGTALLLSRRLIETVGLLDEALFAYWEDTDLSIRANAAGLRNIAVLDADVFHVKTDPSISESSRKPHFYYYMTRNEILLARKHISGVLRIKSLLWSTRRALLKIDLRPDEPAVADALLAGLWDGVIGKSGEYTPARRMPQPFRSLVLGARGSLLSILEKR